MQFVLCSDSERGIVIGNFSVSLGSKNTDFSFPVKNTLGGGDLNNLDQTSGATSLAWRDAYDFPAKFTIPISSVPVLE